MMVAAKAQFEKTRSETAQAIGEQQFRQQKLEEDMALRQAQLREKTSYDAQRLEIERAKARMTHASNLGALAADMFKTGVQAHTDRHVAAGPGGNGAPAGRSRALER